MTAGSQIDTDDVRTAAQKRQVFRALVVLCVTEFVAWGVLFYAMPVAVEAMSADTGWSRSVIFGAFSAGQVLSAFVGIPMGWLLERRGPRVPMMVGTLVTIPSMALIATAESVWQLVLGWLMCGIAMPTLFYQAAFTACTGWMGKDRVKGITAVTLAGGVSSTVFAPLTSMLLNHLDWRMTWLVLETILVVILLPLQWFFLTPPWTPVHKHATGIDVGQIARSPRFIGLSASVTVFSFSGFAVCMTIVSLMTERGFSHGFGATVLGVIGIGQLLGRLGFNRFSTAAARNARNMTIVGSLAVATLLFVVIPGPPAAMLALAIVLGASRGAGTLMHATMVVDLWGPARYGALVGIFTMPLTIAQALAPWAGASIASALGSFRAMDILVAGLTALSAIGIYLSCRRVDEARMVA